MTDTPFQDPALHTSLALTYIEELLSFLTDDATSKLWRAKGMGLSTLFLVLLTPYKHRRVLTTHRLIIFSYSLATSYASSPNPSPFLTYFEATTPASPAKHARLRTALFLQTSSVYDASAAGALLGPHAPLLAPELAIIASKVRAQLYPFSCNHSESKSKIFFFYIQLGDALEALSLLVRTVHDHTSAAAFCTSNGAVIPPRAAAQIAERAGLAAWAPPSPTTIAADAPTTTDNTETKRLLHLLLTIYTVDTTYASRISSSFRMKVLMPLSCFSFMSAYPRPLQMYPLHPIHPP